MLVQPKHLQWKAEEYEKTSKELEESVRKGELSRENADQLLAPKRFTPFVELLGDRCFACAGSIKIPAVMWHGSHPTEEGPLEIWLHPECVERFTQVLMRDANEAVHGKDAADAILRAWKKKANRVE